MAFRGKTASHDRQLRLRKKYLLTAKAVRREKREIEDLIRRVKSFDPKMKFEWSDVRKLVTSIFDFRAIDQEIRTTLDRQTDGSYRDLWKSGGSLFGKEWRKTYLSIVFYNPYVRSRIEDVKGDLHEFLILLDKIEQKRVKESSSDTDSSSKKTYIRIEGNVGNIGDGPFIYAEEASINNFNFRSNNHLDKLTEDLAKLCSVLSKRAREDSEYRDIALLKSTIELAKKRESEDVQSTLSKVGHWTLDAAKDLSLGVAAAALSAALGIGVPS